MAQANAVGSTATLAVYPNYAIQSWGPATIGGIAYGGETVLGYLHAMTSELASPGGSQGQGLPSGLSFSMPYVQDAWNDATSAGIAPRLFVKQIQRESNFNPAAVSPAGAIGIAQFMPATAAGLGFDPHDPQVSLRQAAFVMAQKVTLYHGDYSQALAAYNAGDGAVASARTRCGMAWLSCLPRETQDYVAAILS
ncbi:lytic transglycosylase domain-containing protein [Dictyobacter formicarum]|uniref:Transglycosylase SLT domain-containing protein n=1 Tax=Dictyobacter formicarum TaxID=2778368 RepID=A0ABQ3VR20_9CHLR|nr:lytic transglycosylase domain-containing protein [Dictyobacter formicarum]GHO88159.1 hypothetical protein KSZ_61650 [Dictyobacter formicarum]